MIKLNNNVLNAIKLISYSLELSIHYLFNTILKENEDIMSELDSNSLNEGRRLNNYLNLLLKKINEKLNNDKYANLKIFNSDEMLTKKFIADISSELKSYDDDIKKSIYDIINESIMALNNQKQKFTDVLFESSYLSNDSILYKLITNIDYNINLGNINEADIIFISKLFLLDNAVNGLLDSYINLPEQFKNNSYTELIGLYKLIDIEEEKFNNNDANEFNHFYFRQKFNNDFNKYLERNNNQYYYLYFGIQKYHIDYFNLLYTFNKYAKDNYNQVTITIDNIFTLYQTIDEIYKYNYIIYIFDKEEKKILKLKNYTNDNQELKKHLDNIFDNNFKELKNSINLIKKKLKKIEKLANEYIDIYNKINGYKIYNNPNPNPNSIYIGIYPKIQFPIEIKYTLEEEKNINILNYLEYNKYKDSFFHNFVLYFQDIGIYTVNDNDNLLKGKIISNNYNIIITNYITSDKNKGNKLYFYDPKYLKLKKQKLIEDMINIQEIKNIRTDNKSIFNDTLSDKYNKKIKENILNEILENKFDTFLKNAIDNLLKKEISHNIDPIIFSNQIKDPELDNILLSSLGFNDITFPNYNFTNNGFLSISKNYNYLLKFYLYFDTKYFESANISILKYYKNNDSFINNLLNKNKSILFKKDIIGQTPIYYAINSNNKIFLEIIINKDKDTLMHYDNKNISPLKLSIKKQLDHLNSLLDEDDNIYYLKYYIKMLNYELESNEIKIPLNIEAVFIIALYIQNHIFGNNHELSDKKFINRRKKLKEIFDEQKKNQDQGVNDYNPIIEDPIKVISDQLLINMNETDDIIIQKIDSIFIKYNKKASDLENEEYGLYGTYWHYYEKNNNNEILNHIFNSKILKNILILLQKNEQNNTKFNVPKYDKININKKHLNLIKIKFEKYLKFINYRFNKKKIYEDFLNKIYVHVLANIIGVDFYLTIKELIVKYYIGKGVDINIDANKDKINEILKNLKELLINNDLDVTNINYLYITEPIPESVLKNKIKEMLLQIIPGDNNELINTFETALLPMYRDLYRITYKYLKMFMENYHKFIYNQYHGLDILLLLLDNISS